MPLRERLLGLLAAVLSGGLLFAAGEPLGAGVLAWIALVPLFVAIVRTDRVRWAWLYGLVFGLAYFGVHLVWIFLFGWMAWTGLTIFLALYVSIGTLVAGVVRRSAVAPVLIAGAWTGAELARDRVPWGGYSWGSVGTTQAGVPGVRWLAGVIGVYGLTFLIAFFSALVAKRLSGQRFTWSSVVAVGVVLMAFIVVDVQMNAGAKSGRPVQLAVVQGGVPRPVQAGQRDAIFENHVRMTRSLLSLDGGDRPISPENRIVIWPEEAIGEGVSVNAFEQLRMLALEAASPFLVGQTMIEDDRFLNVVRHVSATGDVEGTYQKRHPVPFGEYVPVAFLRRFIGTLESEIPVDQVPGTRANVFDVEGIAVATPICFESVFPRDVLDFTRNGAEVIVLSTNDTSFERSYAAEQHLAHTRMRALETRQWAVQAALSGISAAIAPDGEVSHQTESFTTDGFIVTVDAHRATSLYSKTGDLFPSLFALATFVGVVFALRRRRLESET